MTATTSLDAVSPESKLWMDARTAGHLAGKQAVAAGIDLTRPIVTPTLASAEETAAFRDGYLWAIIQSL